MFHKLTRNNFHVSLPCTQTGRNHSTVVRPGCTFLRRFINALRGLRRPKHRYRVSRESKLEIEWWNELSMNWNGKRFFELPQWHSVPDLHISTNASGKFGYGGFFLFFLTMNGLTALCPWNRRHLALHTMNYSRSYLIAYYGDLNGSREAKKESARNNFHFAKETKQNKLTEPKPRLDLL